jgi:hypothetical protein
MREQAERNDRVERPVPKRQFQKISHYIPGSGIPSAPPCKVPVTGGGTPVYGDVVAFPSERNGDLAVRPPDIQYGAPGDLFQKVDDGPFLDVQKIASHVS